MAQSNLPDFGTLRFALADIDPHWIPNYRSDALEEELDDLRDSVQQGTDRKTGHLGVKQAVMGCWNKEKTKALLAAGFRRFEAAQQVALAPLVREYNEHFKYEETIETEVDGKPVKSVNPKFIFLNGNPLGKKGKPDTLTRMKHRLQIREQGGEWATKYDEIMAKFSIEVSLQDYGDPTTDEAKTLGKADNLIENTLHSEPSFYDECKRVYDLREAGIKGSVLSRKLKLTAPQVSQYQKIHQLGESLRTRFSGDALLKAYPDEADRHTALATLESGIAEFINRMKLSPKDSRVIEISKAREITYALDSDKEPISLKDSLHLLSFCTRLDEDGKPTSMSTPDLSQIVSMIKTKRQLAKSPEPPPAATKPATPEQALASLDQSLDEAMKMVSGGTATPAPAPAAAPTPPVAKPAPEAKLPAASETLSGDAAIEAQIAAENRAANADIPPMEMLDEDMSMEEIMQAGMQAGDDDSEANDELAAAAAASKATQAEKAATGEMRSKTTDAAVDRYKMLTPENLESRAVSHIKVTASHEAATMFDISGSLFASMELFSAIGLKQQERTVQAACIDYTDAAGKYLAALEAAVEKFADPHTKAEVAALKPKFTAPSLS